MQKLTLPNTLGPTTCPDWLKEAYKKAVEYTCEDCLWKVGQKHEKKKRLEIHRIIPGYKGGTYRPGNVKVCCNVCHGNYAEGW